MNRAIWILWPSFVVAGATSALLFLVLDPVDSIMAGPFDFGRMAVYSLGFFFFWVVAAASSALTCFLQR